MIDSVDPSLEEVIAKLPRREPPLGWERRVWSAIETEASRPWWRRWFLIPAIVVAVAVIVLYLVPVDTRGRRVSDPRAREADALQARGAEMLATSSAAEEAISDLGMAFVQHQKLGNDAAASTDACLLSEASRRLNQYADALRWAERARIQAVESGDESVLGRALYCVGNVLQRLGDEGRALDVYAEATALLPATDRVAHAQIKMHRARHMVSQGRPALAAQLIEEARALATRAGDAALAGSASIGLAEIALLQGSLDEAERHLRDGRATGVGKHMLSRLLVSEAALARGHRDLSGATAALVEAARYAPPDVAWTVALQRGLIAESVGGFDEAERRYREAVEIVEEMRQSAAPRGVNVSHAEQLWEPSRLLFALQLKRGDARMAFATLAQAQDRMFVETLTQSLADTPGSTRITHRGRHRST